MSKYLISLLTLIGTYSATLSAENSAAAYFPLHVGNTWQYRVERYDRQLGTRETSFLTVRVLKDTVLANGKSYFYLTGLASLHDDREPGYVRIDSLSGKIYCSCTTSDSWIEQCDDNEISFYDFGLADSIKVFYYCRDSSYCYAEHYVGFGRVGGLADSSEFKSFWFFPGLGINRIFSKYFGISAWSIGEASIGAEAKLIYARINGKEFGRYISDVQTERPLARFYIYQNFPNPFNPATTIRFELPRGENVSLHIIDLLGRRVRTLVESRMDVGEHSVVWDGLDDDGTQAAAGLYFARLRVGDEMRTIKLLLVR